MRKGRPKIAELREPPHIAFVSRYSFLKKIADRITPRLEERIPEAGVAIAPYRLAAEGVFLAFACTPIAVAGIILGLAVHPAFFVLLPVPMIFFLVPSLRIRSMIGDRRRGLEEELPFFAIHASILQSAGLDIYNSLCSVIGRGIFKQIEQDAAMARRNVEFFGQGTLDAVEEVGRTTPNQRARDFLLGYTSDWRSGGDVTRYLETRADDYLRDVEFRWRSYARRVTDIGEMMIAFFFLLPLMIAMAAFLSPELVTSLGGFFVSVLIPGLAVAVLLSIRATQPKTYDILGGNYPIAVAMGVGLLLLAIISGVPGWLSIILGLGAATTAYGIFVYFQMRETAAVEDALPRFLRDITELRKMGHDPARAVIKASEENEYNPTFDRLLGYVARQLGIGRRMSEIELPTRCWMAKVSFFHLGMVVETGGGTPRTLELLTRFSSEVKRIKRETKQGMRLYRGLSVFSPLGLGLAVGLMLGLMSGFSAMFVPGGGEVPILGEFAGVSPAMVGFFSMTIVAASVALALLSSVAIDFTCKNTLWITVNLSMAGIGIMLAGWVSGGIPFLGGG